MFKSLSALRIQTQDCLLCGVWSDAILCGECHRALPHRAAGGCRICGESLDARENLLGAAGASDLVCGACMAEPPHYDATVSAFRYEFPLDRLMQSYKFSANLALVNLFADALAAKIAVKIGGRVAAGVTTSAQPLPDCIVPMPLGGKRLAERGFNQAALLAAAIGKTLGVPSHPHDLLRVRETRPQSDLPRKDRLSNVKGAFGCDHSLNGMHIALLDDVMTTGATLSEAARALKKAGAARVDAWVVARVTADRPLQAQANRVIVLSDPPV